jgi:hypothetical protein
MVKLDTMFRNRAIPMTLLLAAHVIIPLGLILWLWFAVNTSLLDWIMIVALTGAYVTAFYFIGFWGFIYYYLRYLWLLLFGTAMLTTLISAVHLPLFCEKSFMGWLWTALMLLLTGGLIYLITGAIRAQYYPIKPINMAFPFKGGTYTINWGGNGGASRMMNYHYTSPMHTGADVSMSMQYAVDIVKLNRYGIISSGILPKSLEKYEIFHVEILAPVSGTVREVVDGLPNEKPFSGNYPYNVGNRVVIDNGEVNVLLGHMQDGSITVKVGDHVDVGQVIGKVGNSGWTDQPHTHIQAMTYSEKSVWFGRGIPITFDGKNPVKARLFVR